MNKLSSTLLEIKNYYHNMAELLSHNSAAVLTLLVLMWVIYHNSKYRNIQFVSFEQSLYGNAYGQLRRLNILSFLRKGLALLGIIVMVFFIKDDILSLIDKI